MPQNSRRREFLKLAGVAPFLSFGVVQGVPDADHRQQTDDVPNFQLLQVEWPQQHYDSANTGRTFERGPSPEDGFYHRWQVQEVGTHPTVAGGKLFTGRGGDLVALDMNDGAELWRKGIDGRVRTQPAVTNGVVVVQAATAGSSAYPTYGSLQAFNANDGSNRWAYDLVTGVESDHGILPPTVANGTVYVAADAHPAPGGSRAAPEPDQPAKLVAIAAETGEPRWRQSLGGSIAASYKSDRDRWIGPKPAVADGTVYVAGYQHGNGLTNGVLAYALDARVGYKDYRSGRRRAGTVEWSTTVESDRNSNTLPFTSSPAVADGTVWVNVGSEIVDERTPTVYAFDADTGDHDPGRTISFPKNVGVYAHTPTVADGRLFVTGKIGRNREGIWAFHTDSGRQAWHRELGPVQGYGVNSMGKHQGGARYQRPTPVVSNGTVYLVTQFGVIHALDVETGDQEWVYAPGKAALRSIPTVVEDHLVVQGVPDDGSGFNLYSVWDGGLKVSLPTRTTALSGLRNAVELELHNQLPQPTMGIEIDARSPSDHVSNVRVEDPVRTLPPSSGGDDDPAKETVTISFDVAPAPDSIGKPLPIEVEVTAPSGRGGFDRGRVVVEETLAMSAHLPDQGAPLEAGESVGDFVFDVTCNDERAVENVELIPRFSGVAGDWSVIDPKTHHWGIYDSPYENAGGDWEEMDQYDDKRWTADGLDTEESRSPGIRLRVPDGIAEKDKPRSTVHDLKVDGYVETGNGRRKVNTIDVGIPVYERRLKVYSIPPFEPQFEDDAFVHEVYATVEDDPVEDVHVAVKLPETETGDRFGFLPDPPDDLDLETTVTAYRDGSEVSVGGEFSEEAQFAVWEPDGTVEPGTTFAVEFVLRTPGDVGRRKFDLVASVEGSLVGGRDLQPNTDTAVVTFAQLEILHNNKVDLADVIDDNKEVGDRTFDDSALVRQYATPVRDRGIDDDGGEKTKSAFYDRAVDTLERMLEGEFVVNRTMELMGPAPESGTTYFGGSTDINLAKVYTNGVISYAVIGKVAGKVMEDMFSALDDTPVTEFFENLLGGFLAWGLGILKSIINGITAALTGMSYDELVAAARQRGSVDPDRQLGRQAEGITADMKGGTTPEGSETRKKAKEGIVDKMAEVTMARWEQGNLGGGISGRFASSRRKIPGTVVGDAIRLMEQLQYSKVKDGLAGDQRTARQAGSVTLSYLEGVAQSLEKLIATWSDSLVKNMDQFFEKVYDVIRDLDALLGDEPGDPEASVGDLLYDAAVALFEAFQVAAGIAIGGVPKILIGASSYIAINGIRKDAIDSIISGERPTFTAFPAVKWERSRGRLAGSGVGRSGRTGDSRPSGSVNGRPAGSDGRGADPGGGLDDPGGGGR